MLVVDRAMLINLSFEPLKTVQYSLSFEALKFDVEFLFCSIHEIYDVKCLAIG